MAHQSLCEFGTWDFPPGPLVWGKLGKAVVPASGPVLGRRADHDLGFSGLAYFLYSGSRFILHYRKDVAVAVLRERGAGVPQAP